MLVPDAGRPAAPRASASGLGFVDLGYWGTIERTGMHYSGLRPFACSARAENLREEDELAVVGLGPLASQWANLEGRWKVS
jgi:hypothetical protein